MICYLREANCLEVHKENKRLKCILYTILGVLQREFQSCEFNENLMDNLIKTHFVINEDNGQILGFKGDNIVRYVEVVHIWWRFHDNGCQDF